MHRAGVVTDGAADGGLSAARAPTVHTTGTRAQATRSGGGSHWLLVDVPSCAGRTSEKTGEQTAVLRPPRSGAAAIPGPGQKHPEPETTGVRRSEPHTVPRVQGALWRGGAGGTAGNDSDALLPARVRVGNSA